MVTEITRLIGDDDARGEHDDEQPGGRQGLRQRAAEQADEGGAPQRPALHGDRQGPGAGGDDEHDRDSEADLPQVVGPDQGDGGDRDRPGHGEGGPGEGAVGVRDGDEHLVAAAAAAVDDLVTVLASLADLKDGTVGGLLACLPSGSRGMADRAAVERRRRRGPRLAPRTEMEKALMDIWRELFDGDAGPALDVIDATARVADGSRARDRVLIQHPLQPFDPRNFTLGELVPGRHWGFDRVTLQGARALGEPRTAPPPTSTARASSPASPTRAARPRSIPPTPSTRSIT